MNQGERDTTARREETRAQRDRGTERQGHREMGTERQGQRDRHRHRETRAQCRKQREIPRAIGTKDISTDPSTQKKTPRVSFVPAQSSVHATKKGTTFLFAPIFSRVCGEDMRNISERDGNWSRVRKCATLLCSDQAHPQHAQCHFCSFVAGTRSNVPSS